MIGQDAADSGYRPEGREPHELLDAVEAQLTLLRTRGARGAQQGRQYAELVAEVEGHLNAASVNRASLQGLQTGFSDFDRLTKGLKPGNLVIIGGRPGQGKTTLAMNIAERVAKAGHGVAVFSMEMSGEELTQRSIASMAGIPFDNIRDGSLSHEDWDRYGTVSGELRAMPIWIDETGGLSPLELRARARRIAARQPMSLLVVDYIQLMSIPGSRENRTNEMSEVSRSLKSLAKELKVPIIALSQLNRSVEARDNKRPRMSDLRESGGFEQDADLIVFVYRDEYYNPDSQHKGLAEIIIEKQRNGPRGKVWMATRLDICRFETAAMPPSFSSTPAVLRQRGFGNRTHFTETDQ